MLVVDISCTSEPPCQFHQLGVATSPTVLPVGADLSNSKAQTMYMSHSPCTKRYHTVDCFRKNFPTTMNLCTLSTTGARISFGGEMDGRVLPGWYRRCLIPLLCTMSIVDLVHLGNSSAISECCGLFSSCSTFAGQFTLKNFYMLLPALVRSVRSTGVDDKLIVFVG